jgi:hypothetical protein
MLEPQLFCYTLAVKQGRDMEARGSAALGRLFLQSWRGQDAWGLCIGAVRVAMRANLAHMDASIIFDVVTTHANYGVSNHDDAVCIVWTFHDQIVFANAGNSKWFETDLWICPARPKQTLPYSVIDDQ